MLLEAIAKNAQSVRWYDFYSRYQPLMEGYLRTNFPTLEAEDVIQDVMLVLMKKLPDYHYDPDAKGHFRNYLIGMVKNRSKELLQKRQSAADREQTFADFGPPDEPTAAERISEAELREWRHHAYEVALAQLMSDETIQERSRHVFERVVVNRETPESVAAAYGITRNSVDQIKNRLLGKLREKVAQMVEGDAS